MKKIVSAILIFTLMLSLAACSEWSDIWGANPGNKRKTKEEITSATNGSDKTTEKPSDEPTEEAPQTTTGEATQATTGEPEPTEPPPVTDYNALYEILAEDFVKLLEFCASDAFQNGTADFPEVSDLLKNAQNSTNEYALSAMLSELRAYGQALDPIHFGYILHDLNDDAIPEMFWVDSTRTILAIFTCRGDQAFLLETFASRYWAFVASGNVLCTSASSSAVETYCDILTLEGDHFARNYGFYVEGDFATGVTNYYEYSGSTVTQITQERFQVLNDRYFGQEDSTWHNTPMVPLAYELEFEPYLVSISRADFPIWTEPHYGSAMSCTVGQVGTYTIVDETYDAAGTLWGKLKSGVGWIDLDLLESEKNNPSVVTVGFADQALLESGNYHYYGEAYSEYAMTLAFYAHETLTNVTFSDGNYFSDGAELYQIERWEPSMPFVAYVSFPGDMSAFRLRFTDGNGVVRTFDVWMSGLDGRICLSESAE